MRSLTQTEMKNVTGGLHAAGGGMHSDLYPAPGGGDGGVIYGQWVPHDSGYQWGMLPNGNLYFESPYLSELQGALYGEYNPGNGSWLITDNMSDGSYLSFSEYGGSEHLDFTHDFNIDGGDIRVGGGLTYDGTDGVGAEVYVTIQ